MGVYPTYRTLSSIHLDCLLPFGCSFLTLHGKTLDVWFLPLLSTHLPLKAHLFYWALFFMFVGSSIYALFCPGMIKRYENHLEYAKSELDVLKHPALARNTSKFIEGRLKRFRGSVGKISKDADKRLQCAIAMVQDQANSIDPVSESAIAPLLLAHWQFMNRTYPICRIATYLFYGMGLSLIALIAGLSFLDVLRSYLPT